jgi:hypothetical protein
MLSYFSFQKPFWLHLCSIKHPHRAPKVGLLTAITGKNPGSRAFTEKRKNPNHRQNSKNSIYNFQLWLQILVMSGFKIAKSIRQDISYILLLFFSPFTLIKPFSSNLYQFCSFLNEPCRQFCPTDMSHLRI